MSLQKRIDEDLIKALKAREQYKVTLLRGLNSDIKYKKIEKREELNDDEIIAVLTSAAKRRRDSIDQFAAGNRQDLVDKELAELDIIFCYLPEQLSEEKLRQLIDEVITETGADSPSQMGLVMKGIMPKVAGRADGKTISKLVQEKLAGS